MTGAGKSSGSSGDVRDDDVVGNREAVGHRDRWGLQRTATLGAVRNGNLVGFRGEHAERVDRSRVDADAVEGCLRRGATRTLAEVHDGSELDDAGHVDRVEGRLLVLHTGQLDDDGVALHADVRLGDAAALEFVADQVAHDGQVFTAGVLGGFEDDTGPTLQVEPEQRCGSRGEVRDEDRDDGDGRHQQ